MNLVFRQERPRVLNERFSDTFDDFYKESVKIMSRSRDPMHKISHITDVVENTVDLLTMSGPYDDAFINSCLMCAYWHDTGISGNYGFGGVGVGHEQISSIIMKLAFELIGIGDRLSPCYQQLCIDAIANHSINNKPVNKVNAILYDADKIGYIGVNRWKDCIKAGVRFPDEMRNIRDTVLISENSKILYDKRANELREALPNLEWE